jgi:uncharacterized membrane protein (UPF0127 family)
MKDMLFPLDIIWIKDDKIVNLSRNLSPSDNPQNQTDSVWLVNFVLEVNAGFIDNNDIKVGDEVKIDKKAAD